VPAAVVRDHRAERDHREIVAPAPRRDDKHDRDGHDKDRHDKDDHDKDHHDKDDRHHD
jgi:zinc transport system substrate-binding protein